MGEQILVADAGEVRRVFGDFQAFLGVTPEEFAEKCAQLTTATLRDRDEVETDQALKQFVTYMVIAHEGEDRVRRVFCYRRNPGSGEQRLHGLMSLGVGGHVAAEDHPLLAAGGIDSLRLFVSANRELEEEYPGLGRGTARGTVRGLINDDSNDVGRVHLGVVYVLEVRRRPDELGAELAEGACWLAVDELVERRVEFETWSRIAIDSVLKPEAPARRDAVAFAGCLEGAAGV